MNLEHYKAAAEATDADERALIPGFKRIRPQSQEEQREAWDEQAEHDNDLRYESMVDYESWLTDANQHDERESQ